MFSDDRARAFAAMPRLLAGETHTVECRIVRPDGGGVRDIRDTWFQIRDGAGSLRRLGGTAQDVTEEHAREEMLERRIAERTAERNRGWRNSRDLLEARCSPRGRRPPAAGLWHQRVSGLPSHRLRPFAATLQEAIPPSGGAVHAAEGGGCRTGSLRL